MLVFQRLKFLKRSTTIGAMAEGRDARKLVMLGVPLQQATRPTAVGAWREIDYVASHELLPVRNKARSAGHENITVCVWE
jgi:hypothetical protein